MRPTAGVLAGLAGPGAQAAWQRLTECGDGQRMNAVLRFLFAVVIIDEHRGKPGTFDDSRIDIQPPLNTVDLTVPAELWLRLGGLSIQPGEFANILIIVVIPDPRSP